MNVLVSGKVIKTGVSKKGNNYCQILVPSGNAYDVVCVLTKSLKYSVNDDVKIQCTSYIQVASEI